MIDQPVRDEESRKHAEDLFAEARRLEANREYEAAIEAYEASLRLYEDEKVQAAYFRLLSLIGPK